MGAPFIMTSWQNSFLQLLLDTMLESSGTVSSQDFSHLTFIVPHNRPQLYLMEGIKKDARFIKPCVLPHIISAQEIFPSLREILFPKTVKVAKQLDMVAILLRCIRQLPNAQELLFSPTTKSNATLSFLPWGIRLAQLFEECFTHSIEPENFLYEEYRVTHYAAKLLQHIGTLFKLYKKELDTHNWTTPGYDAYVISQYLHEHKKLPQKALWHALRQKEGSHLYIAGFFALSGAENALFHYLWQDCAAQVLLHGDTTQKYHWSCAPLNDWAKLWQTSIKTLPANNKMAPFSHLHFVTGFDLHSQLTKIHEIVQQEITDKTPPLKCEHNSPLPVHLQARTKRERPAQLSLFDTPVEHESITESTTLSPPQTFAADTVIVLPDTGLLMPMLHHMPSKDINISMGYPLQRSSLFSLLDGIIQLQQNKVHGLYHWRDIVNLIRHPYIKMLQPQGNEAIPYDDASLTLRKALHLFEDTLRKSNQVYINPREFFTLLVEGHSDIATFPKDIIHFFLRLERTLLNNFSAVQTPFHIARALHHFCKLLLTYGKQLWKQFPIDAECLFRLHSSIIPELSSTDLSHEVLTPDILYSLVRTLIESERVPFEATPLVGVQLLGMLETRLLNFKRVIIPECTDDLLPGISIDDPLLPDPLRREIGLPSKHNREEVMGYHFYRLLASAEEITLLWQEGGETTGLLDTKKRRSRFVEELLWNVEKSQLSLLSQSPSSNAKSPLEVLTTSTTPIHTQRTAIASTPHIREAIKTFLAKPLSATVLDCYLSCPTKFILRYILKIDEAAEVSEGQDLPKIGNAIHTALYNFYAPRLGDNLPEGATLYTNAFSDLLHIFHTTDEYKEIRRSFPADVFTLFSTAGEIRLRNFLMQQPETHILTLEKTLLPKRPITHSDLDLPVFLQGRADRIDIRYNNIHILDYKTGSFLPTIDASVWEAHDFWDDVTFWTPDAPIDPLPALANLFPSIQLPLYIALFHRLSPQERLQIFSPNKAPYAQEDIEKQGITAAFVAIGSDGCEKSLFTNVENYEYATKHIVDTIEALLSFLTRHMLLTPSFLPREGAHCTWCPYKERCIALN